MITIITFRKHQLYLLPLLLKVNDGNKIRTEHHKIK